MHEKLKVLTLAQQRELHLAIDCYKNVKDELSSLNRLFEMTRGARTTRSTGHNVKVPNYRTVSGRKAFSFRGPDLWNEIAVELKSLAAVNAFKNAYIRELLRDANHPGEIM